MRVAGVAVAIPLLFPLTLSAQGKPDLSGNWTLESSRPIGRPGAPAGTAAGGGAGGGGAVAGGGAARSGGGARLSGGGMSAGGGGRVSEIRIAQTVTSLTIERVVGPAVQTSVYTFDGQENVNVNGRMTSRTRSRWDGSRLITEGTLVLSSDAGDMTMTIREVRSLGADGTLVVESERTAEGVTSGSRQVFKKN